MYFCIKTNYFMIHSYKFYTIILALLLWLPSAAQEGKTTESSTPKGKVIISVFTNLHSGFGIANNERGFSLDRSYFGYEYNVGKGVSFKAVVDAGKSSKVDDIQRIVFIKNAQATWKNDRWNLNLGLISTTLFKVQEDFWNYRYMLMSFQDQYRFGSSADLGFSAAYKVANWLSMDGILVNGEGYKKIQFDDGMQFGVGATITPYKGFKFRLYGSINGAANDSASDTYNLATMAGYKNERFTVAAEYNLMKNTKHVENHDLSGISFYTTVKASNLIELFARYDQLFSKDDWNIASDEKAIITGLQFKVHKYVKIAPNFRMMIPSMTGAKNRCYAYISCFFGL